MEPSVRTETPAPFFRNAWMENALRRASSVRTTIRAPSESATQYGCTFNPLDGGPCEDEDVRSEEFARRESASAQTK